LSSIVFCSHPLIASTPSPPFVPLIIFSFHAYVACSHLHGSLPSARLALRFSFPPPRLRYSQPRDVRSLYTAFSPSLSYPELSSVSFSRIFETKSQMTPLLIGKPVCIIYCRRHCSSLGTSTLLLSGRFLRKPNFPSDIISNPSFLLLLFIPRPDPCLRKKASSLRRIL